MTYQELCSFDTLWTAYHRARRCKRGKKSTAPFEYSAIEELLILSKSLLQGTHQPGPLDAFYIYEPKKRLIQAPTFRDKVVQHALTDYIVYDELARSFTLNTYAAQYGKGTHYGLEMLKRHMRTYFLRRKGADEARRAAGIPAARPGPDERRTKRYGTVTFQSGKRQPGEAGGKQQAHQVHQAGQ